MAGVALVTGGAVRVGRAIALSLARGGWDIALHYNSSVEAAGAVADEIRRLSRRCGLFEADLRDVSRVNCLIDDVIDEMGSCDVLINNASVFVRASLAETDDELLDMTMAVNFRAPYLLMRNFAKSTGARSIINILDSRIAIAKSAYFAYSLSKKALADCTRQAAVELAPAIRVNGICPGVVLPADGRRAGEPKACTGSVRDVTDAVEYLLSNETVTGEMLFVGNERHSG